MARKMENHFVQLSQSQKYNLTGINPTDVEDNRFRNKEGMSVDPRYLGPVPGRSGMTNTEPAGNPRDAFRYAIPSAPPKPTANPASTMIDNRPRCHLCQSPSHFKRQCPRNRESHRPFTRTQVNQNSYRDSVYRNPASLYIRAFINGRDLLCLLDTGSEANILPVRSSYGLNVRPTERKLFAVNGSPINLKGEVSIMVQFGSYCRTRLDFIVSPHVNEVILGMGFLRSRYCNIDFGRNCLHYDDQVIPLISNDGERWCRRIQTIGSVTLPDFSPSLIPARMLIGNRKGEENNPWMLEHRIMRPGVHVARALYDGGKGNTVVEIVNINKHEIPMNLHEIVG